MIGQKTNQLDELFEAWKLRAGAQAGRMCLDGIIHEATYELTKPKILFIAKEPNHPEGSGFDFRIWWSKTVEYAFAHRLCEWAYGIQNSFPPLAKFDSNEKLKLETIRTVAFMNLKKIGGGSSSDKDEIRDSTIRDKDLLATQIAIIAPDLIVGGIGDNTLWSFLFPGIEFRASGFDIGVARFGSFRIVDFYHPSYRVPRAMSYSLLSRVLSSKVFDKL